MGLILFKHNPGAYAGFILISKEELKGILPEYVWLDEFYRAEDGYLGMQRKKPLEMYPAVPVLGLFVTNITVRLPPQI